MLSVGVLIKRTVDWVIRLRRNSEVYFDRRSQSEIRSTRERYKYKMPKFQMNEPAASIIVDLRIPGRWSHPRDLIERLPDGCRVTPEALILPDGARIDLGFLPPDDQFPAIFRSSCRRLPPEQERATADGYTINVTLHGFAASRAAPDGSSACLLAFSRFSRKNCCKSADAKCVDGAYSGKEIMDTHHSAFSMGVHIFFHIFLRPISTRGKRGNTRNSDSGFLTASQLPVNRLSLTT